MLSKLVKDEVSITLRGMLGKKFQCYEGTICMSKFFKFHFFVKHFEATALFDPVERTFVSKCI